MSVVLDSELRSPKFSVATLIDNVVYHELSSTSMNSADMDPLSLEGLFISLISTLKLQLINSRNNLDKLKTTSMYQLNNLKTLLNDNASWEVFTMNNLDTRINLVVAKVIHMGHQLESRTSPRDSLYRAKLAAEELQRLRSNKLEDSVFLDIDQGCSVSKILLIATEPASNDKSTLNNNKYSQIGVIVQKSVENVQVKLLQRFEEQMAEENTSEMRRAIKQMDQNNRHKAITELENKYLDNIRMEKDWTKLFSSIPDTFSRFLKIVFNTMGGGSSLVSSSLEIQVVEHFLDRLISIHIQPSVKSYLDSKQTSDNDNNNPFVVRFSKIYSSCIKLANQINATIRIIDFRSKIGKIFDDYLKRYKTEEIKYMKSQIINDAPQQASSSMTTNICDLCAVWIDECKKCLKRISDVNEEDSMAIGILNLLLESIVYKLVISKVPNWDSIADFNNVIQMLERYLNSDQINHQIKEYSHFMEKKAKLIDRIENQINEEICKLIDTLMIRIKNVLSEQRKSGFKITELDETAIMMESTTDASSVCSRVCELIKDEWNLCKKTLDGENLRLTGQEIGMCFHQVLCKHIYRFEYSLAGGLLMLQDVSEYKRLVGETVAARSLLVRHLFSALQALVNLVVVVPENLDELMNKQQLSKGLSDKLIGSFVSLRVDQKAKRPDWIHRVVNLL
ncbi:hypothetical protein GJ496_000851 [Pomphorhynchus laevis]|nr:hypothetical protein GJ496_000851 [Pomphorhynchus laevis]